MSLLADWQLTGPLLMLWPYRNDVWRGQAQYAQQQVLTMLAAIAPHHPVILGIHPPYLHQALPQLPSGLAWFPIAYDDAWARDISPLWLTPQQAVVADFNGWHDLNCNYQRDRRFAKQLTRQHGVRWRSLELIFEGGMLTTDGAGTAIIHAKSLMQRNPQLRLAELERRLCQMFGLKRVIWLQQALGADETGGHVDNQVQFIAADTLVYVQSPHDPAWNAEVQALQQQPWAQAYRWIALPAAQTWQDDAALFHDVRRVPGVMARGQQPLLRSYANLLRLKDVLLVPQFAHADDALALQTLQQALPEVSVVGVDAREFVRAGGGPHCMTTVLPSLSR
ncbi:hypothetical protein CWI80_07570 [Pseudidiomarina sediminum]|uniref:Agmatine deiminase family protein n=1 Tax=Pseudidiomarina sediminum TaxID=431675 RepID=A0A432Z3D6_9GAMM|nr:agmatine deiminase family protein [Pseudidiomarina sediminum]RUO72412.1 hypothetical protein CWI80_07570 [Pseudidiomarina sediminum]